MSEIVQSSQHGTARRPPLIGVGECLFEVPRSYRADMRVPARLFAEPQQLKELSAGRAVEQLVNVTTLPGIEGPAFGMPDMHEGYGFPVGGVAATRLPDGVISPGGIGFDINCGVRLLTSPLRVDDLRDRLTPVVHELSRAIPVGYGHGGRWQPADDELDRLLAEGVPRLIRRYGFGTVEDIAFAESEGCLAGADPGSVSDRAKQRGRDQLGTLGGGNHFVEVQRVESVFDEEAGAVFGLREGTLTVLIHSGSRGLGHQVCTDYVRQMDQASARHGLTLVDRQLAAAPLSSREGQSYFRAMCAAANFGFCNRQLLAHRVREALQRVLGPRAAPLRSVYDVAHNVAKIETYGGVELCVHRKGATRAFGPHSPEIPPAYRGVGQPVFIPGSMGTASYVLSGTSEASLRSLSSVCHGAGRALSRTAAKSKVTGNQVRRELESRGIVVRCPSPSGLAEEAPFAYKDVDQVVEVVVRAGLARRVARLVPLGVIKG